jgi:hypothetical protein
VERRRHEVSETERIENYSGRVDPLPHRPENGSHNGGDAEVKSLLANEAN